MISLDHVTVCYGSKPVLTDFSLTLPETGVLCLMGPSGCGKTTLLRALLGLEPLRSGSVSGLKRGGAAVLFQEDRLLPWFTILRNITEAAGCSDEKALALLEAVGLADEANSLPAQLSGGMRRRAALARALAYPSALLVLDEPLKGLDSALKERLYPLIRAAAQTQPVLMVTHDREEALALADRTLQTSGPPLRIVKEEPASNPNI